VQIIMTERSFPNEKRNIETDKAIAHAELGEIGAQSDKRIGIAEATATFNVAESLQMLQLQIEETALSNRKSAEIQTDKLIVSNAKLAESNNRHSRRIIWLTWALVIVGLLQVVATWQTSK
jgi:hypothetical protein